MREVDEAVRQDELSSAAKRYGIPLAIVLVLGLGGLGGYLWWQGDQHAKQEAATVELTLATDRLEAEQPDAALDMVKPLQGSEFAGARVSAQLMEAGIAQRRGETDRAAELFGAVSSDEDAPAPLRDLATLRLVSMQFDEMSSEDVIARLKPLAVPGNAFFASAAEMVGMAYIEQGKTELAGPLFAEIARDEDAPDGLRNRARQVAGLLGTDAIDDVDSLMQEIQRNSAARQAAAQQAAQQAGQ